MAITLVTNYPNRTTPFSVVLSAIGDTTTDEATVTRAALLGYCVEGPLKAYLTRNTDWSGFNVNPGGADCAKVHVRFLANATAAGAPADGTHFGSDVHWDADNLYVDVASSPDGSSGLIMIEIRLSHSMRY